MSDRKQVRIGVDSTELESNFQRLKSRVDETAQELIRNARAYSSSSREVLQDIEEQIKAIERLNKAHAEERHYRLEERKERGEVSEKGYQSGIQKLEVESKEEKIQTQLLRELIREQRELAKEEIRERRTDIERQIQTSKTVDQLSPEGDAYGLLRETMQRGILGDIKTGEAIDRGGGVMGMAGAIPKLLSGDPIESGVSTAGQAFQRSTAGTNLAKAGILGYLASQLFGRGYREAEDLGRAAGVNVAMGGGGTRQGWIDYAITGTSPQQYGFGYDDVLEAHSRRGRARGGTNIGAAEDLLIAERLGFSDEQLDIERLLRGTGQSAMNISRTASATMRASGMANEGELHLLPEYMRELIGISQQQLNRLGETDVGSMMQLGGSIASLTGIKNPQVLGNMMRSIEGGLSQAGTPQQRALQYSVLSQMRNEEGKPLSFFEMEEWRADPFGKGGMEYTGAFLERAHEMSMGDKSYFLMNLMELFSLQPQMARRLGEGFIEAEEKGIPFDAEKYVSEDFKALAKESTTIGQVTTETAGGWVGEILNALNGISSLLGRNNNTPTGERD